jgi:serine/threonine protein kinase
VALEVTTPGQPEKGPAAEPVVTWSWGHLQVFEHIGTGAYGDVFRAWDKRLDREVALKVLSPGVPSAGLPGATVIEQGRLLAGIRHPNMVTIYGAERIDERVGLWMEFVSGRTLEQALLDGRTFTTTEVTQLGVDLCGAVSAVHAAGLLHRDITAQNVMLDDGGRVVLMDFGIGRELDATTDVRMAGTPLHMAPEVLAGGAATPRSDVYSFGVVLFRLLRNACPVPGSDLSGVIARAVDPEPDRRYESADALGAALALTGGADCPTSSTTG